MPRFTFYRFFRGVYGSFRFRRKLHSKNYDVNDLEYFILGLSLSSEDDYNNSFHNSKSATAYSYVSSIAFHYLLIIYLREHDAPKDHFLFRFHEKCIIDIFKHKFGVVDGRQQFAKYYFDFLSHADIDAHLNVVSDIYQAYVPCAVNPSLFILFLHASFLNKFLALLDIYKCVILNTVLKNIDRL